MTSQKVFKLFQIGQTNLGIPSSKNRVSLKVFFFIDKIYGHFPTAETFIHLEKAWHFNQQ